MRFVALFVQSLLWLSIACSPTLIGAFIGIMISLQSGEVYSLNVPIWAAVGFLIGAYWAEHVRKTIGLSVFFGRLAGARDTPKNNKS
ncbi:hypothetical protein EKG38_03065 [Shewanella canadensis]|uniref:Uncharacterized protein n=1 Tax=Shewanella canadensis TaxID=271096 RepID=A0A3S0IVU0_9GAMM|nr:hypothetical protein [Shewanella canadensis]RTR40911.1 hypothetical protein EKG38_03065 [Shewanella canadensis]